jgi:hypothetical protein
MNTSTAAGRRTLLIGVPVTFAALTLLHPMEDPWELGSALDRWMLVHVGQLVLTVLLAYALWLLVDGIRSRSAAVMRVALPVFVVAFTAFDSVAGIATGWLAGRAEDQTGTAREHTLDSIEYLFADNWLAGNLSILGGTTAIAWVTIAIAAAIALKGAGADRLTVIAMCTAVLFANHPAPFGTIGLLAIGVAGYRTSRGAGRIAAHPARPEVPLGRPLGGQSRDESTQVWSRE